MSVCVTLWAVACQPPLSMGFSRQEYWSGLSYPSPGIFLTQRIKSMSLCLLHWQAGFFLPLVPQGSHYWGIIDNENCAYLKDTVWWFHVCTHCEVITTVKLIKISMGLPWWMSGKESAFQCRRHRFDLGPGRSHMPQSMWCMGHDYWACALEPRSLNCWARVLQLLKPTHLESVLFNKRSHQ